MTADTVEQMRIAALTLTGWSSDDVSRKPDVAMGAISSIAESLNRWADEIEAPRVAQPPTVAEAAQSDWDLTATINVEVAIDDRHTENLSYEDRDRLVDDLLKNGASEVMHYGTIIPTFEDCTIDKAFSATTAALRALTKEGDAG